MKNFSFKYFFESRCIDTKYYITFLICDKTAYFDESRVLDSHHNHTKEMIN